LGLTDKAGGDHASGKWHRNRGAAQGL